MCVGVGVGVAWREQRGPGSRAFLNEQRGCGSRPRGFASLPEPAARVRVAGAREGRGESGGRVNASQSGPAPLMTTSN